MSDNIIPITFASLMAQSAYNEEELATLRTQAWVEQGLLIVHPWDRRLRPAEAKLVREIAERLYGGAT